MNSITDQTFLNQDFTIAALPQGEYEGCRFEGCDFSEANLTGRRFIDCQLTNCNLSMSVIVDVMFNNVTFKDCKMLGLHFENCNEFGFNVTFDTCNLSHSSFFRMKVKKTVFRNSILKDVDLGQADFTGSVFDQCDFAEAKFEQTIVEKADFRTSFNYSIDPESNRVRKARFSCLERWVFLTNTV